MRKLYEIFKLLWIQKRIVSAETIRGNTVIEKVMRKLYELFKVLQFRKRIVAAATIWGNTVYELNYQLGNCLFFFTFKKLQWILKEQDFQKTFSMHFNFITPSKNYIGPRTIYYSRSWAYPQCAFNVF